MDKDLRERLNALDAEEEVMKDLSVDKYYKDWICLYNEKLQEIMSEYMQRQMKTHPEMFKQYCPYCYRRFD